MFYNLEECLRELDELINSEDETYELVRCYGMSPEDAIIEMERRKKVAELLQIVLPTLNEKDLTIFWKFGVEGKSQNVIAKEIGMAQPTVWYRIEKMYERIAEITTINIAEWADFLLPPQSDLEAGSPESMGYPYEFAREQNDGGRWGIKDGYRRWISKSKCTMPEYFKKCFPDQKTVCPICDTCKRA